MQIFTLNLRNNLDGNERSINIKAESVELAHKDGYFTHASVKEEIMSITDTAGTFLYTSEHGFSTQPDWTPPPLESTEPPEGAFDRSSDNVNFF